MAREITFSDQLNTHVDTQIKMLEDGREKFSGDNRLWELDYNEALLNLSCGRFAKGWAKFDTRFSLPGAKFSYDHFPIDRWDGSSVAGKHVFVWMEQGLGDQIMMASMLKDLQAAVGPGSVTLLCDRALIKTYRRTFPGILIYKVGDPLTPRMEAFDYDCQLSLSDLGQMFRNKWSDFPGTPFLYPDAARVQHFKHRYISAGAGKRTCGIGWSSVSTTTGVEKTMRLTDLAPILTRKDFTFIDMQYGDHLPELKAAWDAGLQMMHDPTVDQLCDMDDFFAQVAAADMVVTTSQTLAHVAGAVGTPTYVLMPIGKGRLWYWFAEIPDSPWYNSVTLFRQTTPGDWVGPVAHVAAALDSAVARKGIRHA